MKRNVFVFSSCILLLISMFLLSDLSGSNANSGLPVFAATVRLGEANQTKTAIYSSNDSVTFTVTVVSSADVPTDGSASAKVNFVALPNSGNFGYTVSPAERTSTKALAGGGVSTSYSFTITTASTNSSTGTINNQFVLDTAVGATIATPNTPIDVSVTVQSQTVRRPMH